MRVLEASDALQLNKVPKTKNTVRSEPLLPLEFDVDDLVLFGAPSVVALDWNAHAIATSLGAATDLGWELDDEHDGDMFVG